MGRFKNNWRGCLERYSIMEEKVENLESLLNYIIKELVETKDKVNVTYEVLDSNVTFKVSVAKGEMGKIIGKNGLTANAIRGVMQAAGVKDKLNVNVESNWNIWKWKSWKYINR